MKNMFVIKKVKTYIYFIRLNLKSYKLKAYCLDILV